MNTTDIESTLHAWGLKLRGLLTLTDEEIKNYDFSIKGQSHSLALIGNIGSSFWSEFTQSGEYQDGKADPLDRWSTRAAEDIAIKLGATALFPFQGPPYLPFQQWAKRAEGLHQSPLGLLIHPQYGLWHAYRFALLLPESVDYETTLPGSPCESCIEQPCLNTCPVNAITTSGYDVEACAQYLIQNVEAQCYQKGCIARYSCPAGRKFRYVDQQSQFHLRAFIDAKVDQTLNPD